MEDGKSNMLVVVRIRPLNEKETYISNFETVKTLPNNEIVLLDPQFEMAAPEDVAFYLA